MAGNDDDISVERYIETLWMCGAVPRGWLTASMFGTVSTVECPCVRVKQDASCPVGYPSLLCSTCLGRGTLYAEKLDNWRLPLAVDPVERSQTIRVHEWVMTCSPAMYLPMRLRDGFGGGFRGRVEITGSADPLFDYRGARAVAL